jgi:Tol biopolymer transport system component
MMKRLLILILFCTVAGYAQENGLRVPDEPVKIADGGSEHYMNPRWSPDGTRIAFTGLQYRGLWILELNDGSIQQISDEMAAGFGFQWSSDSKAIAARVSRYEGVHRQNAIKVFDIEQGRERALTEYLPHNTGLPQWVEADERIAIDGGGKFELLETGITAPLLQKQNAQTLAVVLLDGALSVADARTGRISEVNPFPDETYLNTVLSPDGTNIVFEIVGGNLYVINIDGTGLIDLGRGNRPQWSPDGDYVVYMIAEDDGHQITSSTLYAVRNDGTEKTNLTQGINMIAMNPSWSPDGSKIAFDVLDDGAIYIIGVER